MNLHKSLLLSLALLAPTTTAFAAINDDIDGGGGGGGVITEPDPGDDAPVIFARSYNKQDYWGATNWGAGYQVSGRTWAMPAVGSYKDRLGLRGSAEAYARLNGNRVSIFRAVAAGSTEAKKKTEASLNAYAGSANIYSKSWASTTSTKVLFNETKGFSQTFFDKTYPVDVLGIPVSFRAKGTGGLMVSATGKLSNVGVEAAATPAGYASLYLSAAVGGEYCVAGLCVGASAGVYSDVKLISISAPASASTWWSLTPLGGALVNYAAKADVTISSLDGEAGVFADACLGGCIHKELKLVDWTGFSHTYSIANYSGSYCLAGQCSIQSSPE